MQTNSSKDVKKKWMHRCDQRSRALAIVDYMFNQITIWPFCLMCAMIVEVTWWSHFCWLRHCRAQKFGASRGGIASSCKKRWKPTKHDFLSAHEVVFVQFKEWHAILLNRSLIHWMMRLIYPCRINNEHGWPGLLKKSAVHVGAPAYIRGEPCFDS